MKLINYLKNSKEKYHLLFNSSVIEQINSYTISFLKELYLCEKYLRKHTYLNNRYAKKYLKHKYGISLMIYEHEAVLHKNGKPLEYKGNNIIINRYYYDKQGNICKFNINELYQVLKELLASNDTFSNYFDIDIRYNNRIVLYSNTLIA